MNPLFEHLHHALPGLRSLPEWTSWAVVALLGLGLALGWLVLESLVTHGAAGLQALTSRGRQQRQAARQALWAQASAQVAAMAAGLPAAGGAGASASPSATPPAAPLPRWLRRLGWAVVLVFGLLFAAVAWALQQQAQALQADLARLAATHPLSLRLALESPHKLWLLAAWAALASLLLLGALAARVSGALRRPRRPAPGDAPARGRLPDRGPR